MTSLALWVLIIFVVVCILVCMMQKSTIFEHLDDGNYNTFLISDSTGNLARLDSPNVTIKMNTPTGVKPVMNIKEDGTIQLLGNTEIAGTLTANVISSRGDLNVTGNALVNGFGNFGPAYIGQGADQNWAQFVHKTAWATGKAAGIYSNTAGGSNFHGNDFGFFTGPNNTDLNMNIKDKWIWAPNYRNLGNSLALVNGWETNATPYKQNIVNKAGTLDFNRGAGGWDLFLRTFEI